MKRSPTCGSCVNVLICCMFTLFIGHPFTYAQFPVNNALMPFTDGVTYSGPYSGINAVTPDFRDVGMDGADTIDDGMTFHIDATTWPDYQLYWGFDGTDGIRISAQGPPGSQYTHPGSILTLFPDSTDLPNGYVYFTGYTTFSYLNAGYNWVVTTQNTRFQMTVTDPGGNPIPLIRKGDLFLVDITQHGNFKAHVLMSATAPSGALWIGPSLPPGQYAPVITLFDKLHNNQSPQYALIYTTFNHHYYTQEDIWIGNTADWDDASNWSYTANPPMTPYGIRIPGSPAGGNTPNITVDTTIIVKDAEVHQGGNLLVNSPAILICGIPPMAFDTVFNPATGLTWMDRNLGASKVPDSALDHQARGHLFQWGRNKVSSNGDKDHHEFIKWNSSTNGVPAFATTELNADTDYPGHFFFITETSAAGDWRSTQNNTLWQGTNGTNNPCPAGFRLPTSTELDLERASWGSQNAAGAFLSPLKWVTAGYRSAGTGSVTDPELIGLYWSSTVSGASVNALYFNGSSATLQTMTRATGASVRCIKESSGGTSGKKINNYHE